MAFNGVFQRLAQFCFIGDIVFHRIVVKPVTLVIRTDFPVFAPQVAAGRELFNGTANRNQRFHFRRDIEVAVLIMPHIERDNADMIAANQVSVLFAVIQGEGEHTLQIVQESRAFFLIQREDHFAVGASLEGITVAILSAQSLMVVDLPVDCQRMCFFLVVERLSTGVNINNGETFMGQDCFVACINAGPVRAAVAHQAG
ncbi:hypothetical protein ACUY4R_004190 [Kosakonia sp. BK9b]